MARHPRSLAEYQRQTKPAPTPTAKAKAKPALAAKAKAPSKAKKTATPKKKLGGAKVKPAAKKVVKASGDHWFAKLSKKAQAEYIKTHPNSKFAKGAKGAKAKVDSKKVAKDGKVADKAKIKSLQVEHRMAHQAEIKAARKHNSAIHKLNGVEAKHAAAKTPAAKKKLKAHITAAKTVLKAAKSQHREAKKHLVEKKKAAKGHIKLVKKAKRADGTDPNRRVKVAKRVTAKPKAKMNAVELVRAAKAARHAKKAPKKTATLKKGHTVKGKRVYRNGVLTKMMPSQAMKK